MRRKDREITDQAEALNILRRCDTIRLAMLSGDEPYIVPLSFGMEVVGAQVILYFHSALIGRKVEALAEHPRVCIEGDIFLGTETTAHGITTRYESIIGFGTVQRLQGEEQLHGLRCLLAHYGYSHYPLTDCRYLPHTAVYKITLTSLTAKRNLPEG